MRKAVLLGLVDTGYGMVRSFHLKGVETIAFERNVDFWRYPEMKTSLCEVRRFKTDEELFIKLRELALGLGYRAPLFASSDDAVYFISQYQNELAKYYSLDLPSRETVAVLLEKTRFSEFAPKHGFLIPNTICLGPNDNVERTIEIMSFPCVVKPIWRKASWSIAKFPKVFRFEKKEDLVKEIGDIQRVEEHLIIQEWIPGDDSSIVFCLTYFDGNKSCVSYFTGRKVRQWPVGLGQTSCAIPIVEPIIKDETLRLFELVGLTGFGSLEFKQHRFNGRYYIMEPTVGRPNHQSYLATANGVNMAYASYRSLTKGNDAFEKVRKRKVMWIDELADIRSVLWHLKKQQLRVRDLVELFTKGRSFRYVNLYDLKPVVFLILSLLYRPIRKAYRRVWAEDSQGSR
jgi:D-aspartate ligase